MSRRNLWTGFIIVIAVSSAIFFRGVISRLLDFNFGRAPEQVALPNAPSAPGVRVPTEGASSTAPASPGNPPVRSPETAVVPVSLRPNASASPSAPSYTGRDPAEVRPVPDEVKVFTDSQKQKLYAGIASYGAAAKAHLSDYNVWMQLGILKKEIGDFEGARDAWEYAGMLAPQGSVAFANLGDLYWRYLHDFPKAEANLKIAIAHKSDDAASWAELSDLYYYSYKEHAALADQVLLDGLKSNPDNDTLMRHLAYLYEMQARYGDALTWWKKVLDFNPQDQEVANKINALKAKLGITS